MASQCTVSALCWVGNVTRCRAAVRCVPLLQFICLQDLMGASFRTQMKMDGQYGSITFVCTKTDDVSPSEISESLASVRLLWSQDRRNAMSTQPSPALHVGSRCLRTLKACLLAMVWLARTPGCWRHSS